MLELDRGEPNLLTHSETVLQFRWGAGDLVEGCVAHLTQLWIAVGLLSWMVDRAHNICVSFEIINLSLFYLY